MKAIGSLNGFYEVIFFNILPIFFFCKGVIQVWLKSVKQFKPLSHQINALTAIPLHPREMQNDEVHAVGWHRMPNDGEH